MRISLERVITRRFPFSKGADLESTHRKIQRPDQSRTIRETVDALVSKGTLTREVANAIISFRNVRNQVIVDCQSLPALIRLAGPARGCRYTTLD